MTTTTDKRPNAAWGRCLFVSFVMVLAGCTVDIADSDGSVSQEDASLMSDLVGHWRSRHDSTDVRVFVDELIFSEVNDSMVGTFLHIQTTVDSSDSVPSKDRVTGTWYVKNSYLVRTGEIREYNDEILLSGRAYSDAKARIDSDSLYLEFMGFGLTTMAYSRVE